MSDFTSTRISFLGAGQMGQAMVRRLLAAGHRVTVWNRTFATATPLAAEGAVVAATPAEAVTGCDVLVTMLFDDAAYEQTLAGSEGALAALSASSLHIACGTISVALSRRFAEEHARHGQDYVAAPVFGRPNVAAEGRLWIVAAGETAAVERARPLLGLLSRGISVVGNRPEQAHAVKLAGNFMITMMVQAMSEVVLLAEGQGIDPERTLETINSALFQSPFYAAYGDLLLHAPERPGATLDLGFKDLSLFLAAAQQVGVHPEFGTVIAERLRSARDAGLGREDWASGMLQAARAASAAATLKS